MLENSLPKWSRPTLTRLMQHQWEAEKPAPLTEEGEKQLGAVSWVVDTYMRYDENPVHDSAMGQPGVVKVGSTTLTYGDGEEGELEAIMDGFDKKGRPVTLFMERSDQRMEAYSVQDLGDGLYLQGGQRTGPGEGFYLSHYSPENI
jgi:hypothetical protein